MPPRPKQSVSFLRPSQTTLQDEPKPTLTQTIEKIGYDDSGSSSDSSFDDEKPTNNTKALTTHQNKPSTPAQLYRMMVSSLTPHQKVIRHLQTRYTSDLTLWTKSTLKVQALQRGGVGRVAAAEISTLKAVMTGTCKGLVKVVAYVRLRKYREAIEALDEVIRKDPVFKVSYFIRGRVLFVLGEVQKSMNDYTTVLMPYNEKQNHGELLRLRLLLYGVGMLSWHDFMNVFVHTLVSSYAVQPKQPKVILDILKKTALINRSRIHLFQHNYTLALGDVTNCIESFSSCAIPSLFVLRIICNTKLFNFKTALEDVNLPCLKQTNDFTVHMLRGGIYANLQQHEDAYNSYTYVIEKQKPRVQPNIYCKRGRLLCCMRRFDEAVNDYSKAVGISGGKVGEEGLEQAKRAHVPLPLFSKHGKI